MAEAAPAEGEAPAEAVPGEEPEAQAAAVDAGSEDVSMEDVLGKGTRKRPAAKADTETDPVESKTY